MEDNKKLIKLIEDDDAEALLNFVRIRDTMEKHKAERKRPSTAKPCACTHKVFDKNISNETIKRFERTYDQKVMQTRAQLRMEELDNVQTNSRKTSVGVDDPDAGITGSH